MSQPPPSTQHHYAGQQGWNDCMPEALLGASKSKGIRRPRRVASGAVPSDSGTPSSSNYPSNNASTDSLSRGPSEPPSGGPSGPSGNGLSGLSGLSGPSGLSPVPSKGPSPAAAETQNAPDAGAVLEKTLAQLEQATLPDREAAQYRQRFEKIIPELEPVHLVVIEQVLNDPSCAKDVLSRHSLAHNGISPWMAPLRRIVSVR